MFLERTRVCILSPACSELFSSIGSHKKPLIADFYLVTSPVPREQQREIPRWLKSRYCADCKCQLSKIGTYLISLCTTPRLCRNSTPESSDRNHSFACDSDTSTVMRRGWYALQSSDFC